MKISKVAFLVLFLVSQTALGQKLTKPQQIKLMNKLISEYNPHAAEMIQQLVNLPNKFTIGRVTTTIQNANKPETWLRGNTPEDVRGSLGTIVHEMAHGFTSYYAYQVLSQNPSTEIQIANDYSAFKISKAAPILVAHTDIFNSNVLKKDIPKELRTFRYSPYIAPKSNLGSQKQGVYGLLDEFNAYYQGILMSYNLFPIYQDLGKENPQAFQDYFQHMSSDRLAFYEFKYFILTYLVRAQSEHPDVYDAILANKALRKAYTQIHNGYQELLIAHDNRLAKLMKELNSKGIDSYIKNDYFFVENQGIGMNMDEIALLNTELEKAQYIAIHKDFLIN